MKTPILLFLLFMSCLFVPSYAQLQLGVEGGPSLIRLWGDKNLNNAYQHGLGFSGAFFLEKSLSASFSVKGIVGYERKGSSGIIKVTDEQGAALNDGTMYQQFGFVPLTVMLKYKALGEKLFFNLGPYAAYLHEARNKAVAGDETVWNMKQSGFRSMDYGVSAGIGALFALSRSLALSVEVRNNLGLRNLSDPAFSNLEYKTNSTSLLLGLSYAIRSGKSHASF